MTHEDVGNGFARDVAGITHFDVGAHTQQRIQQAGARRIDADALDGELASRRDRRRYDEERRRRKIAAHGDGICIGYWAAQLDRGAIPGDVGAKVAQHPFGVVA